MQDEAPPSPARTARRAHILEAARALRGVRSLEGFDPVRTSLCAIDVVMVAGSPWLKDGLERDFAKDEAGYKKIGGGANSPEQSYFFRSPGNLVHYLKRAGFYIPRGGRPTPAEGMACFFDWDDRGRFNFTPDRSGIVTSVQGGVICEVVLARQADEAGKRTLRVETITLERGDGYDRALVGYADLP
jgi:hypothetical protein